MGQLIVQDVVCGRCGRHYHALLLECPECGCREKIPAEWCSRSFEKKMCSFFNDDTMIVYLKENWSRNDTASEVLRKFIKKEILGKC